MALPGPKAIGLDAAKSGAMYLDSFFEDRPDRFSIIHEYINKRFIFGYFKIIPRAHQLEDDKEGRLDGYLKLVKNPDFNPFDSAAIEAFKKRYAESVANGAVPDRAQEQRRMWWRDYAEKQKANESKPSD